MRNVKVVDRFQEAQLSPLNEGQGYQKWCILVVLMEGNNHTKFEENRSMVVTIMPSLRKVGLIMCEL